MSFDSSHLPRRGAPPHLAWFGAAWLAALLVAACGGGSLVSEFKPQRIIAFGDQTSAITQAGQIDPLTQQPYAVSGRKFSVNAVDATSGAPLCQNNPNWVQYLAETFRLPFPQCNPDNLAAPSIDRAANGAKVADLPAQIDAHLASDSFSGTDLVTLLIGANDVLEQYALYDGSNEAALTATLEQRGGDYAVQVNRIARAGGKVIVSTVPDLGLTPFALAQQAAHAGDGTADRAPLLTRLTARYNAKLRVGLLNDSGREIGLVLGDQVVQIYVKFPSAGGFVNVTQPACTVALPDCTNQTLDSANNADGNTWFWADATNLSAGGQRRLGMSADVRARNNPF